MYYICKLLKDLPGMKSGTVFYMEENEDRNQIYLRETADGHNSPELWNKVGEILDDPEWIEKTADERCLTDLKCTCGNTNLFLYIEHTQTVNDDGIRIYYGNIAGRCPKCGNKNIFKSRIRLHSSIY